MNFPESFFKKVLLEILQIDSPSGFTAKVTDKLKTYLDDMGIVSYYTRRGNLVATVQGASNKTVGISAHVDTLGLVVRGFNSDGTLSFSKIGGVILPTLDGEYCKIYTRWGDVYTGTILSKSPAGHVFGDAHDLSRDTQNMEVKLDEEIDSADGARQLGILPGDYICYDPKSEITEKGFIKSRFLDDKLSVAIILAALKYFKDNRITPANDISVIFSTHEEVGHGLSHMPDGICEFVAVDMGCIGDDLSCTEYDVSICAKDSGGPYDYELTTRLIKLAKAAGIQFAVDVYPSYSSDLTAAWRAGHDVKGALIGPGVAASHGMERSHMKAAVNAWELLMRYLT